jgi:hypothetical protein
MDIDSYWFTPAPKSGPFYTSSNTLIGIAVTVQISELVSVFAETTVRFFFLSGMGLQ